MPNNTIQNIDEPQDNPTIPNKVINKKLPKDPKIIILIILIFLITVLSLAAIFVSATKNNSSPRKTTNNPSTIPTTAIQPMPSITSHKQIPEEFAAAFEEIEKEYNNFKNLLPPQIDANIGIEKK